MDKKSFRTYVVLILAIVVIIIGIFYFRNDNNGSLQELECIAQNSQLIVKEGCSACAYQKSIIGEENLGLFNITDCAYDPERCGELSIEHIPTWVINSEKYEGARSIQELKSLTGC